MSGRSRWKSKLRPGDWVRLPMSREVGVIRDIVGDVAQVQAGRTTWPLKLARLVRASEGGSK